VSINPFDDYNGGFFVLQSAALVVAGEACPAAVVEERTPAPVGRRTGHERPARRRSVCRVEWSDTSSSIDRPPGR